MAISNELTVHVTYNQIDETHLLIYLLGPKISQWLIIDLEEIAKQSHETPEEILERLQKSLKGDTTNGR